MQDVIRMTYDAALCHPDEITKIWSLSHPDDLGISSISSGWLIVDTLCHPDDLPDVGISSGWVTANSLCHPDDIHFHFMSSGWLNWGWFLIRMSYGNVIMSSGWDTRPFLSHPDEIANFDFPHYAVALQRFCITVFSLGISLWCRNRISPSRPCIVKLGRLVHTQCVDLDCQHALTLISTTSHE